MGVSRNLEPTHRSVSEKHYTPTKGPGNTWQFTTPTGKCDGFLTRADALRIAANTERDDRNEAATKSGPIATVLRTHFGITKKA